MPKMKTHKGAKKRFEVTGSGKIRRRHSTLNHMLGKKSAKRKRALEKKSEVFAGDVSRIRRQLGI